MVGQRLRAYRKKKGYKLAELAKLIGISHGSLSDIENEKTDPSTETLLKYVRSTDINLAWVFTGEGPMVATGVIYTEGGYMPVDDITERVIKVLSDMSEEGKRDVLKYAEEKELLRELKEERKKMKEAG